MISAAQFRPIRRRVLRSTLVVAGFVERGGGRYERASPSTGQVHVVTFSSTFSSWEGLWVDLGCHFACVPPFGLFEPRLEPTIYVPRTCAFSMRLRDAAGAQVFPYGDTPEQAEAVLRDVAAGCVSQFGHLEAVFGDGRALLADFTPERMRADAEVFGRLIRARTVEGQSRQSAKMYIRRRMPGWRPDVLRTCLLLAHLALEHDLPEMVPPYVEIARHPSQDHLRLLAADTHLEGRLRRHAAAC